MDVDSNGWDGSVAPPILEEDSDIDNWGNPPDGLTDEQWRVTRASRIWTWLRLRGGFWGDHEPDLKTLITILLIEEGVSLMNSDSYKDADRLKGIQAMVGLMRYLFDDADGITATDLSTFTAFFNPEVGNNGAWTQTDREIYQRGHDAYTWSTATDWINTYWDAGPVYHDGHMVTKWWDNTENFGYTDVFLVNIPVEQVQVNNKWVNKILYFGY